MRRARGPAEMPFLDHLEELRWRILWSLAALVAATLLGFFLVTKFDVLGILQRPIAPFVREGRLMFTSPTEPMAITLKMSFLVGFVLAFPVIAYHAWAFFSPALFEHERKVVVPSLVGALALFLAGMALAYFAALPLALRFLMGFQSQALEPIVTAGEYLKFATRLILAFGLIFELPILALVLSALGVITPAFLRRYRRHAVVFMAIVAALLTPADLVSMLIMLVPLILLYELSVFLSALVARPRQPAPDESPQPVSD